MRYEVTVSMIEIYQEIVQDLLIAPSVRPRGGLHIRESKALGIYVDSCKKYAVDSYAAIENAMERGINNRSVAATRMNNTSSRAHTVIIIEFNQIGKVDGLDVSKVSTINLVDLAGSEKASQSGAMWERLKEGSLINKSLLALGNVIEKLAEVSSHPGKRSTTVIPYRDSKLTRLLQNALGGSSKTIMICAISPASTNFEETLSTLRYADRAKKIKNTAKVNENPQVKLFRELQEENVKLKQMLEAGGPDAGHNEALCEQKEQIARLQQALDESQRSFQERLEETKTVLVMREKPRRHDRKITALNPTLVNLNEDAQLTGRLRYDLLDQQTLSVGCANPIKHGCSSGSEQEDDASRSGGTESGRESDDDEEEKPGLLLRAPGVCAKHALISNRHSICVLSCVTQAAAAKTWINGTSVLDLQQRDHDSVASEGGVILDHADRITFGSALFMFVEPAKGIPEMMIMSGQVTYAKARKELPKDWRHICAVRHPEQLHIESPPMSPGWSPFSPATNSPSGRFRTSHDSKWLVAPTATSARKEANNTPSSEIQMSGPLAALQTELESKVAELDAKSFELEEKSAELEAKSAELEAKSAELDAVEMASRMKDHKIAQLQQRIRELEQTREGNVSMRLPAKRNEPLANLADALAGSFGDAIAALDAAAGCLEPYPQGPNLGEAKNALAANRQAG